MATPGKPDMFDKAMVLYDEGKFMEGYTLITENAHEHPDFMQRSFYFRHCLIARAGDLTLAEEILEDALDQGYFFSENALRKEDDLAELQGRQFFEKLVSRNLVMLQEAQKNSRPLLQILQPHNPIGGNQPFLMALHGNSTNLKYFMPTWNFITHTSWLAALPQSSQLGGSDVYVWNDQAVAMREIEAHYQRVLKHYRVDPQHTLISGFSMGGHIALKAALEQTFPIAAFLLVCPYFAEFDSWIPLIDAAAGKPLKGYFLLGELDESCNAKAKAMQKLLEEHDIPSGVEIFTGIRHEFPADFEHVFKRVAHSLFPDME